MQRAQQGLIGYVYGDDGHDDDDDEDDHDDDDDDGHDDDADDDDEGLGRLAELGVPLAALPRLRLALPDQQKDRQRDNVGDCHHIK